MNTIISTIAICLLLSCSSADTPNSDENSESTTTNQSSISKCNFDINGKRQGDAQWFNQNGSIKGNGIYSNNIIVNCSGNCN